MSSLATQIILHNTHIDMLLYFRHACILSSLRWRCLRKNVCMLHQYVFASYSMHLLK